MKIINNLLDRIFTNKKIVEDTKKLEKELIHTKNKDEYVLFDYTSSYSGLITYYYFIKVLNQKLGISNFKYINNSYIKRLDIYKVPNRNFDYFFKNIMNKIETSELKDNQVNKSKLKEIINNFNKKEEIVYYKIDGLLVGDLIYDTYLKWNKVETIDMNDKNRLFKVFLQAHTLYNEVKKIYSQNCKINYYITGDIAYIYSGISARYLAKRDIKVINFIESKGLDINFLDKQYFYRRHKYWEYNMFNIENIKHIREISKNELQSKLENGEQKYIYMKNNTFSYDKEQKYKTILDEIKKIEFKVLIPLHCFMDSPHLYRWICYADFYEWITDTLNILETLNIKAIIKPHPNGFPENDKIILKLKTKFKNHIFIDKNISNRIFIDMKVDAVLTVYGSVGYEFAYFDIPVISAGDNPHVAFNFVKTCINKDEYQKVLQNIKSFTYKIDKNEIYDFYYIHYIKNYFIEGINPIYPFGLFLEIINNEDTPQVQRESYHHNSKVLDIEMKYLSSNHYDNIEKEIEKRWF